MFNFFIFKEIDLKSQMLLYSFSSMPKEKTSSKHDDNWFPNNLLNNKRVFKEDDKVESDNDNK